MLGSLEVVNALNEGVYQAMSVSAETDAEYIITRTRFQTPMTTGRLTRCWLRSTVMDPFLADPPPGPDHISGFLGTLARVGVVSLARLTITPPV